MKSSYISPVSSHKPHRCRKSQAFSTVRIGLQLALAFFFFLSAPLSAQEMIDPALMGLDIPRTSVKPGGDRRVSVRDDSGELVVAKLHCETETHFICMIPSGELVIRKRDEVSPADQPFVPLDADAVAEHWKKKSELADFSVGKTNHYVYLYNSSDAFALGTSRILETMLPGVETYSRAQKIDTHDPEVPLVAIMFKTEEEFQAYRPMPRGVVAYYNMLDNSIVMYEQSRLAEIKPELAIRQSINVIAHEGAHQILHNIGVQQRLSLWPMWLGEGLAEFYAPTSTDQRLKWKGAGQINDMRMFELENFIKGTTDRPSGQMVDDVVGAARLTSTGYAAAWSLTHYLAKNKRVEFNNYVKKLSELGPLQGFAEPGKTKYEGNLTSFKEHFGDKPDEFEARLIGHLKKQPYVSPFADAPHYAALISVTVNGKTHRRAEVFIGSQASARWLQIAEESVPAEQRGSIQKRIVECPNRPSAERVAGQFLSGR